MHRSSKHPRLRHLTYQTALVSVLLAGLRTNANAQALYQYSCDEGSGPTVFDSSGNGHNATRSNNAYTTVPAGYALHFDSSHSNPLSPVANTIYYGLRNHTTGYWEATVRPTQAPSSSVRLLDVWSDVAYPRRDFWYVALNPNLSLTAYLSFFSPTNAAITISSAASIVPLNQWTRIGTYYDGSVFHLLVNDVDVANTVHPGRPRWGSDPGQGDQNYHQIGYRFLGDVDQILLALVKPGSVPCFPVTSGVTPPNAGAVALHTQSNCQGGYSRGTTVSIAAVPTAAYRFSQWSGSGGTFEDASVPTTGFTVSDTASITAAFLPACTFGISPTAATIGPAGTGATPATTRVTTSSGCNWTATSNSTWIAVTSGSSGTGSATVSYEVQANTGGARAGTLTVAGQTFTVQQNSVLAPTISSFTATPAAIASGQSSTLTWATSNGTSASIDNGINAVATSGSRTVAPGITTTYTLTVIGPGGTTTAVATVTVSSGSPLAAFTFAPISPRVGDTVQFTDSSIGGPPTSWAWSFSVPPLSTSGRVDSTSPNPTYRFFQPGFYRVLLTVRNASGTSSVFKTIQVAATSSQRQPILFVHGFCSDAAGAWSTLLNNLQAPGISGQHSVLYTSPAIELASDGSLVATRTPGTYVAKNLFTITFRNNLFSGDAGFLSTAVNDVSIEELAGQLKAVIDTIKRVTGSATVDLVGHSMGGLAARAYIEGLGITAGGAQVPFGNDVRRIITLDTPHQGATGPSWDFFPTGCFIESSIQKTQMLPDSAFLSDLNSHPIPDTVSLTAIAARSGFPGDGIVTFASQDITSIPRYACGAANVDALPLVKTDGTYPEPLHVAVHDLPEVATWVDARLSAPVVPRPFCGSLHPSIPQSVFVALKKYLQTPRGRVRLLLFLVTGARPNAGDPSECRIDVLARADDGTELFHQTVPVVYLPALDLGLLPADGWHLELTSQCELPVLATVTVDPDPATLAIATGRFSVTVEWRSYSDTTTGRGQAVPVTPDSGYFWFFGPSNVEVVVKILDGRSVNGRFWVLYGALSDVEYTVAITDNQTGVRRLYYNAAHNLASVADINAFAAAGVAPSMSFESSDLGVPGSAPQNEHGNRVARNGRDVVIAQLPPESQRRDSVAAGDCTSGGPHLCLNQNRFLVTVAFTNYNDGSTGEGVGEVLATESGYFWFFNQSNIELIVKVLDGRSANGRFWVLYGALSDVEYTITITDTQTGSTKLYYNPPHNLASVADTNAF